MNAIVRSSLLVVGLTAVLAVTPRPSEAQDPDARISRFSGRWMFNAEATNEYAETIEEAIAAIPQPEGRRGAPGRGGSATGTAGRRGGGTTGRGRGVGVDGGLDRPAGSGVASRLSPQAIRARTNPPEGIGITLEQVPPDTTKVAIREGERLNIILVLGAEAAPFEGFEEELTFQAAWEGDRLQVVKTGEGFEVRDRYAVSEDGARLTLERRFTAGSLRFQVDYVYDRAR